MVTKLFIKRVIILWVLATSLPMPSHAAGLKADQVRVAVASNFLATAKALAAMYYKNTANEVSLISGSTGKHYAQIVNGAPFDVFLAADSLHPRLLEQQKLIVLDSRFSYALGRLVLWSADAHLFENKTAVLSMLQNKQFQHLAIASPQHAPYGMAAQQVLQALGLWQPLNKEIIRAQNIAHAFHYISSGNAQLGFVAYSQICCHGGAMQGSFGNVPQNLYTPIEQQAVLLQDTQSAQQFYQFLQSQQAQQLINALGYELPSKHSTKYNEN